MRQGAKIEKHLCEVCAAKQGISAPGASPIEELMGKILLTPGAPGVVPVKGATCPSCQMTFTDFRQGGLLGCPQCYEAFEAQLTPLVERAHEGGAQHAGKAPKRSTASDGRAAQLAALAERAERLRRLQDELKQAVTREDYERAARLRDELRQASGAGSASQPGTGGQEPSR